MSVLHRGPYIQRGRGFGSALSSMFKGVFPAMQVLGQRLFSSPTTQKLLKTAKQSAIEGGLNVATDVLQGKKLSRSVADNVATAKKAVTDSLVSALNRAKVSSVGNVSVDTGVNKRKRAKKSSVAPPAVVAKKAKRKKQSYRDLFESY